MVLSLRGSKLSQNNVNLGDTAFVYRIGKTLFAAQGQRLRKMTARGRTELEQVIPFVPSCICPLDIPLGKGFNGFALLSRNSECVFVDENGITKHVFFALPDLQAAWAGQFGPSYAIVFCANGRLYYRSFHSKCDLRATDNTDGRIPLQEQPLDVESAEVVRAEPLDW